MITNLASLVGQQNSAVKVTYQASAFVIWGVRTPPVKIMTTYSLVGAWWVNLEGNTKNGRKEEEEEENHALIFFLELFTLPFLLHVS